MEKRPLGKCGVEVSAVGFGGGAFAGLLVRGSEEQQVEAVARAVEAGVTYFDTAAQYGDGLSEQNLGRALAAIGATDKVSIGTKVRLTTEDLRAPVRAIRDSLTGSLGRLGRERVEVFVLHNFPRTTNERDGVLVEQLAGVAEAMRALQQEGLVGCIGLTGVGETGPLLESIATGLFDFVQLYFNALNASALYPGATSGGQDFAGAALRAAEGEMGCMAVRSLAGGALVASDYRSPLAGPTGRGPGMAGSPYDADREQAKRLLVIAREFGIDSALEFGLRFILSQSQFATALIGFSDREQLDAAVDWASRGPLPPRAVDQAVELARGSAVGAQ